MNKPIMRLFAVIVVLFGLLVYFTSKSTVFDATALRNNGENKRSVFAQQKIHRGKILAADGSTLARSVPAGGGRWTRLYPFPSLFSQTVGYSYTTRGRAGLERTYNDALTGQHGEFSTILDQLTGKKPVGDDLRTSLDPEAQRVAIEGLAGRPGSVVAFDPRDGAVKVMASVPGFNQNDFGSKDKSALLDKALDSPIVNRSVQAGYPPGSTFKVVTAIAAIDSGKYTPDSIVSGRSPIKVSGVPLNNDGNEQFGDITLTEALTYSVNTAWARVAEDLGPKIMKKYMDRLGFGVDPPLDFPHGQMIPSGIYFNGGQTLVSPADGRVDLGRMAIGQERLRVTPMQMAMVAAAVANGGVLMKPRLGSKVIDADGRVRETIQPERASRVMSESSAQAVSRMMRKVVEEGTGQSAQLGNLTDQVAGKTGTAQLNIEQGTTQPWFIAFAPVRNPQIAVAVTVEKTDRC